jgi:hypothetical protein
MGYWDFSLTQSIRPHYGNGVDSASNRNEYQEYFLGDKVGRCVWWDNITAIICRLSWNLGPSTSWKTQGLPRPVQGLISFAFTLLSLPVTQSFPATTRKTTEGFRNRQPTTPYCDCLYFLAKLSFLRNGTDCRKFHIMCHHSSRLRLSLHLQFSMHADSMYKHPDIYKYLIISNLQERCKNCGPW